ncbi:conserved hypothetical protein [uncultured Desulfobacterium sp.]|uniref:Sulfotransferase domain-containing protein n=1 Tax=uncultured Desulfobacterium sp. TaxID=201089 RepID=A0A445MUE5_9BACT|nr:conserved hypothetical protein [uncultured Desulfobacterium sp.]
MDQAITIVSGLPRSGTSLMMQMLESGGMEIVTDNIRTADADNPKGYYEFEKVKKIKHDSSWLKNTRGKAFKAVSMLLYDLPSEERYKIIFMKRNMDEILSSQKKMLERLGNKSGPDDDEMQRLFTVHLDNTYLWLKRQKNIDVLYISYNDLILDPLTAAKTAEQFLGGNLNVEKMAGVIDRSLYRNRGKNE